VWYSPVLTKTRADGSRAVIEKVAGARSPSVALTAIAPVAGPRVTRVSVSPLAFVVLWVGSRVA
jgi:hypothetical protein